MKRRGESNIKTAFKSKLRLLPFFLAMFQIGINGIMKIIQKFLGRFALIRDKRTNSHDFTEKNTVFL